MRLDQFIQLKLISFWSKKADHKNTPKESISIPVHDPRFLFLPSTLFFLPKPPVLFKTIKV